MSDRLARLSSVGARSPFVRALTFTLCFVGACALSLMMMIALEPWLNWDGGGNARGAAPHYADRFSGIFLLGIGLPAFLAATVLLGAFKPGAPAASNEARLDGFNIALAATLGLLALLAFGAAVASDHPRQLLVFLLSTPISSPPYQLVAPGAASLLLGITGLLFGGLYLGFTAIGGRAVGTTTNERIVAALAIMCGIGPPILSLVGAAFSSFAPTPAAIGIVFGAVVVLVDVWLLRRLGAFRPVSRETEGGGVGSRVVFAVIALLLLVPGLCTAQDFVLRPVSDRWIAVIIGVWILGALSAVAGLAILKGVILDRRS